MDRRDDNYYEAHAQTIILDTITSSYENARILRRLRRNDPSFTTLGIANSDNEYAVDDDDYLVDRGDDLGWLGYFVGQSNTLQSLYLSTKMIDNVIRFGVFIEGLNRNRSIETLYICADLGSEYFRKMSDFFRSNNNLRELSFGSMDTSGLRAHVVLRSCLINANKVICGKFVLSKVMLARKCLQRSSQQSVLIRN